MLYCPICKIENSKVSSTGGVFVHMEREHKIFYHNNRVTFNQSIVPHKFFDIAHELGFSYRVTGGNDLTHDMACDLIDFIEICKLAEQNTITE